MKKIALITAPCWSVFTPPLGISYLSAALKMAGYDARCFDLNVSLFDSLKGGPRDHWDFCNHADWCGQRFETELLPRVRPFLDEGVERIRRYAPDMAGFSIFYTNIECSLFIASRLKEVMPGIKIVFGGPECYRDLTENRFLARSLIDALVIGEGEAAVRELAGRLSDGKDFSGIPGTLVRGGQFIPRPDIADLNSLAYPDFSDFDLNLYRFKALPLMSSRGCVAKCSFCGEVRHWKTFRYRRAENIFGELVRGSRDHGCRDFFFNDSLINGNVRELSRLADMIHESGMRISWGGYARVNPQMDLDFFRRLKRAGCTYLSFGIESGSQKVLRDMKKNIRLADARKNLRDARAAGLQTHVNWIVGFPTESCFDFLLSLWFVFRNRAVISHFNPGQVPCGILPGSDLATHPQEYGISPRSFLNEWRTGFFASTIITRRARLWIFRRLLRILNISFT
ncbi:MAG: B12-binding domain-containing radical SAM protein [Deltaproteobacteria bacterium]